MLNWSVHSVDQVGQIVRDHLIADCLQTDLHCIPVIAINFIYVETASLFE